MPTYRERLRLEGLVLAACGLSSAALVLAFASTATRDRLSTTVQLAMVLVAMVLVAMVTLGSRSVRRAMASAVELEVAAGGTGQPTALWKLPLIVAVLTLGLGLLAGWDAGLRIGGGCVIVGLAQALLFERLVAAEEARRARRYYRIPGSRILGTRLGSVPLRSEVPAG